MGTESGGGTVWSFKIQKYFCYGCIYRPELPDENLSSIIFRLWVLYKAYRFYFLLFSQIGMTGRLSDEVVRNDFYLFTFTHLPPRLSSCVILERTSLFIFFILKYMQSDVHFHLSISIWRSCWNWNPFLLTALGNVSIHSEPSELVQPLNRPLLATFPTHSLRMETKYISNALSFLDGKSRE